MKITKLFAIATFCLTTLTGCANAVSYHHSERTSITLESKSTDPQEPVQGNVGVKVRTVLVTPGKKGNDSYIGENGEALSVISDFDLDRDPNGWKFATTTIHSAFITGKAAHHAPASSSKALSGIGSGHPVTREMLWRSNYSLLKTYAATNTDAQSHLSKLDQLATLLPDNNTLNAIPVYTPVALSRLDKKRTTGITLSKTGFDRILEYDIGLRAAKTEIDDIENDRAVTLNGKPIDSAQIAQVRSDKASIEQLLNEFNSTIADHQAINNAINFVNNSL